MLEALTASPRMLFQCLTTLLVKHRLPLAQLWTIPAPSITSYPCTPGRNKEGCDSYWSHWGTSAVGMDGRFFTGHVQWKPGPSDTWEATNVQTTISLKYSSGSRPKINEGIFTEFSTGLLAHAVFEIITPFWKTVYNRKVYFFWNSSNSAETVWIDGTKIKSYPSFMKSSIQLTLHNSLWESVKMAIYVQKWLSAHHPARSCTRVQQPVRYLSTLSGTFQHLQEMVKHLFYRSWGKIKDRDMTGSSLRQSH